MSVTGVAQIMNWIVLSPQWGWRMIDFRWKCQSSCLSWKRSIRHFILEIVPWSKCYKSQCYTVATMTVPTILSFFQYMHSVLLFDVVDVILWNSYVNLGVGYCLVPTVQRCCQLKKSFLCCQWDSSCYQRDREDIIVLMPALLYYFGVSGENCTIENRKGLVFWSYSISY